ncbi:MAG: cobalamin biosynthesis protein [Nocardioides sp.]|nr:cobalamin biosynthesis protein [Nocardioides sp.]
MSARARAAGLAAGFLADRLLGDPARFHPVAGFGVLAGQLERVLHADSRPRGAAYALVLVGGATSLGAILGHATRRRPVAEVLVTGVATWAVLGGRSLEREAAAVGAFLVAEDLPGARRRLTHLVGRDTTELDEAGVARAVIESVAENTSDAVVAPLVWGGIAGPAGLLCHRATNTLDAMVGHHNERYESFGWASARLDDVLNVPGSRLSAALATMCAPLVDGSTSRAVRAWRHDAPSHPSPNAGPVESAFAGALGIRLGGTNTYYGVRTEHRPGMGGGPAPVADDIDRSTRLARLVGFGAVAVSALLPILGQPSLLQRRRRR